MYKKVGGLIVAISGLASAGSAQATPWQAHPNSPKHSHSLNFSILFLMQRPYCGWQTRQPLQRLVNLGRVRIPT